jgi:hypothetical protein
MNVIKAASIVLGLALAAVILAPTAKSDEWDKKTILTVNEPIEIPNQVLQPGKYMLKLMDSQSNRHIVQVFNEDGTQLITTILAIPNYRLQPTGESRFGFWEMPAGQPKALRSWFYPGDSFGQEFAYPKQKATAIARSSNESVPSVSGQEVERVTPQGSTEVSATTQAQAQPQAPPPAQPEQQETAQVTLPPPPPPTAQAPAPAEPTNQLPATASDLPLIALSGLLSVGAGTVVRFFRAKYRA